MRSEELVPDQQETSERLRQVQCLKEWEAVSAGGARGGASGSQWKVALKFPIYLLLSRCHSFLDLQSLTHVRFMLISPQSLDED